MKTAGTPHGMPGVACGECAGSSYLTWCWALSGAALWACCISKLCVERLGYGWQPVLAVARLIGALQARLSVIVRTGSGANLFCVLGFILLCGFLCDW
jgi:hypothetical protein